MALHVFHNNEPSKEFENSFFRFFASVLKDMYEQEPGLKNENAILIGFPKVPTNPNAKIDAILITNHRIVIIDFKKYGSDNNSPDENNQLRFNDNNLEKGEWYVGDQLVQGGSKWKNPYDQVKNYSDMLFDIFQKNNVLSFNELKNLLSTCIIFGNFVNFEPVPTRLNGRFSIADRASFRNTIFDKIRINSYINDDKMWEIRSFFAAYKYNTENLPPVSYEDIEKSIRTQKENDELKNKVKKLEKDILNEQREKEKITKSYNSKLSKMKDMSDNAWRVQFDRQYYAAHNANLKKENADLKTQQSKMQDELQKAYSALDKERQISAFSEKNRKEIQAEKEKIIEKLRVEKDEVELKYDERINKLQQTLESTKRALNESTKKNNEIQRKVNNDYLKALRYQHGIAEENHKTSKENRKASEAERDKTRNELQIQSKKNHRTFGIILAIFSTVIAAIIATPLIIQKTNDISQENYLAIAEQEETENLQSGKECFTLMEQLAKYKAEIESDGLKGVCMEMSIADVNASNKYIYLRNVPYKDSLDDNIYMQITIKYSGDKMTTKQHYEKTVLNKRVRAYGTIKKYQNNYQIELGPNDEIEVL
ncbi:MAG: NERD domain-containing protein [Candidatus Saccharibacteria bacterium]|nr:NERD domain-containing protein [Candidatus Saccharibacteria bacterium]